MTGREREHPPKVPKLRNTTEEHKLNRGPISDNFQLVTCQQQKIETGHVEIRETFLSTNLVKVVTPTHYHALSSMSFYLPTFPFEFPQICF